MNTFVINGKTYTSELIVSSPDCGKGVGIKVTKQPINYPTLD